MNQYIRQAQYKKGSANILVIIGLVLLAGIAGYFALIKKQKPVSPQGITAKDETADWKIYRNEKYGFEISLPTKNWNIEENENGLEAKRFAKEREFYDSWFQIRAEFRDEPNSLIPLFANDLNFSSCQGFRNYKKVTFGRENYQACQIIETRGDASRALYALQGNRITRILIQPLEEGNEADKVLSTFKFIKQVPPSATTLPVPSPKKKTLPTDYLKAEVIYVTLADLVGSPNTFIGKKVHVRGYLINTKESYFPSPEFAITDRANGQTRFKVSAWRPFEVPPPPPGSTFEQPLTMQNYLGRVVELTGFVRQTGPDSPSSFYLEVLSGEYGLVD